MAGGEHARCLDIVPVLAGERVDAEKKEPVAIRIVLELTISVSLTTLNEHTY